MIVQSAPDGQPRFVIRQSDHARMCGQLAAAFGNARFAALDPREPLEYIAAHHDEGWVTLDAQARRDPRTGWPYHLTQTPLPDLVLTGRGSPDFNERHHPLSGLLSSMHTWGLYHGRYGLSDKIFIEAVPAEHKPAVQAMLDDEVARQQRLRLALTADPATAPLAEAARLFHNYKLLQFFDTLGLYFHLTAPAARGDAVFQNVPAGVNDDVTVTVRPLGQERYAVSPYPFAADEVEVWVEGRFLAAQPEGTDLAALMAQTPAVRQTGRLVRAEAA